MTRIDHRSLKDQDIDRQPQRHKGPAITAIERRGERSHVVERWAEEDRAKAQQTPSQSAQKQMTHEERARLGRNKWFDDRKREEAQRSQAQPNAVNRRDDSYGM